MKIIHVAGWSGSGKTTFILDLVKALNPLGKVGSVKHIGEHVCELTSGKDTTRHYDAGTSITAGIDLEKTMITCRTVSLSECLNLLSDFGVQYAIVEGFKDVSFKKVVIGDLNKPALIRSPVVDEVLLHLSEFDDYYTLTGLVREIRKELKPDPIFSMTGNYENSPDIANICSGLEMEISGWDGVSGVRIRFSRPVLYDHGRVYVVIQAVDSDIGVHALSRCNTVLFSNYPIMDGNLPGGLHSDIS